MDPSKISHTTPLGKLIRVPFKLLRPGAVVRVLRGPARGRRWIVESSTNGFWLGYWELAEQRRFAAHLEPGDVVYDVGAHVGLYTLLSSGRVGPRGHVFAFEPLPKNIQYLRRHIELNGLENCTVIEAAISESSGQQRFDPAEVNTAGRLSDEGALTVRTLALDDFFFASHPRRAPKAMKINAEGAEMGVLSGARHLIADCMPVIFLSTHSADIDHQCCEFLAEAGYSVQRIAIDKIWAEIK